MLLTIRLQSILESYFNKSIKSFKKRVKKRNKSKKTITRTKEANMICIRTHRTMPQTIAMFSGPQLLLIFTHVLLMCVSLSHALPKDEGLQRAVHEFVDQGSDRELVVRSTEELHVLLSEALSKSRLVQENSQVFIQLGRYLFENSSKSTVLQHAQPPPSSPAAAPARLLPLWQRLHRAREGGGGVIEQQQKPEQPPSWSPGRNHGNRVIQYKPGSAAWPMLHLPPPNATLSNIMRPPGFQKREGRPVELSGITLGRLRGVVGQVGAKHRPQNRKGWVTTGIYADQDNLDPRREWHNKITRHDLYPPDEPKLIEGVMKSLAHSRITKVEDLGDMGTQIKFVVHLEDGSRAMVKPIRWSRKTETLPDHYYFADHERHTAEIAAFHLDRLLNFRRCPPVTGRLINITRDLFEVGEGTIKDDLVVSPAGNICIIGGCDYYCDLHHLICGRPELIEVSMMAFLPSRLKAKRTSWEHPWRKSYSTRNYAKFEDDDGYCDSVRERPLYREGRRLLDLMDTCVFDFLTGNTDRHHYNTFTMWDNYTAAFHIDNGKGFGNSREDELILLLPLVQCCTIRFTTLRTLLQYHDAPVSLGQAMKNSMKDDMIAPVLLDPHFEALDRRVKLILQTVADCLKTREISDVVIDDGF